MDDLAKRERQIMDVLYRLERASVADVRGGLSDPPSYSSVRAMLSHLERKGLVDHEQDGARYIYLPVRAKTAARRSAVAQLVHTFFDGSVSSAVATLLQTERISAAERAELSRLLDDLDREERG